MAGPSITERLRLNARLQELVKALAPLASDKAPAALLRRLALLKEVADIKAKLGMAATPQEQGAAQVATRRAQPSDPIVFQKPIVGPSGAQLVSYAWQWYPHGYVDERGEDRTARLSDWEKSETNAETGREVVHQFTVVTPDGQQQVVSAESALALLGFTGSAPGAAKVKSVASAARTLARLKMEKVEIEQLLGAYARDKVEVDALPLPEIVGDDIRTDEHGRQSRFWRMADAQVLQQAWEADLAHITEERRRVLVGNWRQKRMGDHGWKSTDGSSLQRQHADVAGRIAKAEKKLADLSASAAAPADAEEVSPVPADAKLVTKTFVVQAKGRKWLTVTAPGKTFKMQLELTPVTAGYNVGDTIHDIRVAEVRQESRYGVSVQYLVPRASDLQRMQEQAQKEADAKRLADIERWLGYVEQAAREGRFYDRGTDQLKLLRAGEIPEFRARMEAAAKLAQENYDKNQAAKDARWRLIREEEQRQRAQAIASRVLFPVRGMPRTGQVMRWGGKAVVITGSGKSFRLNESHPSMHGSHLLGHEGELGAYAYFRAATEDEVTGLERREAQQESARQAKKDLQQILDDLQRDGERPAEATPQGDKVFSDRNAYGSGREVLVGPEWVWLVVGNGGDGDDWSRNNVPGAIAYRLPRTDELERRLRTAAANLSQSAVLDSVAEPVLDAALSPLDRIKLNNELQMLTADLALMSGDESPDGAAARLSITSRVFEIRLALGLADDGDAQIE